MTTSVVPRRRPTAPSREEEFGSLASPFARHGLVLVVAAAATYFLADALPIGEGLAAWLAAAVVLGVVAGIVGRRWVGVLFLVAGVIVGLLLHLHLRLGSGEEATHELSTHAGPYGAALAVAAVAYVATVVALEMLARRRSARSRNAS